MDDSLALLADQITIHKLYSQPPYDLDTDVAAALALTGGERILDVGCGTGEFLRHILHSGHRGHLVGIDLRPEAVEATNRTRGLHAYRASAEDLPFGDSVFDRAAAKHVLYYLPDPAHALRELRRVTRPGGRVCVSINHTQTAPRIHALVAAHAAPFGFTPQPASAIWAAMPAQPDSVTAASVVPLMRATFGTVTVHRRDNALLFPSVESLMRYAQVIMRFSCAVPSQDPHHDVILARVDDEVRSWFATNNGGPWRDAKGYTVFTSTR
ncbi:class I SAM-dependent methyltransferase [Nocardia abscessus]|uniref:class I SAM-dependent methyltransferase n=1 Tax=Nocardia abscessus TaxID=120957 RepID=UPI002457116D|nr:methyltransferase domain-containing protein [Nocardia abscessus]